MAGRNRLVADLVDETEAVEARQPGAEDAIDLEMDKLKRMMDDCAGVTDGEIVYWLHRANEKNKGLHAMYLKRYPKETPIADIFDEARDSYGEGHYVLLAKKDQVIFRKLPFSTGKPVEKEKPPVEPKIDPMEKLSVAMERLAVVDKVGKIINDARDKPPAPGIDPVVTLMLAMMTSNTESNRIQMQNIQEQNKILMTALVEGRKGGSGGDSNAMLEAIKLGSALAGKVLPEEVEGGGLLEVVKALGPYVPQLVAMLTGKGPGVAVRPPQLPPGTGVPPIPLPARAPVAPGSEVLAPQPEPPVPVDANTILMRRVVDEIKFVLTLPVTPKLREHIIEYVEAYKPDILQQAEMTTPELFAAYVVAFDPAFAGHESFFADLHRQYMAGMVETPPVAGEVEEL